MSDMIDAFALGGRQDVELLNRRYHALLQELIEVSYLLPPPVQEPPPSGTTFQKPEPTPAENEALRIECEAIAAEYRAPLPAGDAGLIAALQRWEDMAPRIRFGTRGFNVTYKNEEESSPRSLTPFRKSWSATLRARLLKDYPECSLSSAG